MEKISRTEASLPESIEPSLHGIDTDCCIVGAGPAGLMLGLILARAGVRVVVLERQLDFSRDLRGDTFHASTLEVVSQLGLLDDLLRRPHQELAELTADFFGHRVRLLDFSLLPTRARFIALLPQWEFLAFLAEQAQKLPRFRLFMGTEVTELVVRDDQVLGARAQTTDGVREVRARLTVGADGRRSMVRDLAALHTRSYGDSMDVLWFHLPRRVGDGHQPLGNVGRGRVLVLLERGQYWQCAFVIAKGRFAEHQRAGVQSLHADLRDISPLPSERLEELAGWDQVELSSLQLDQLEQWAKPGLLCLGDAAHAMSPIGGAGIDLAIQDAVAAACIVGPDLRAGRAPSLRDLRKVQRRRGWVSYVTMRAHLAVQNRLVGAALHGEAARIPRLVSWLNRSSRLRRLAGRLVALGLRPERVPAFAET